MSFPRTNLLIEMLSPPIRARILSRLEEVQLPIRTVLYKAEQPPRYAHFITSGIASIVAEMEDGDIAEVGIVGREGIPESLTCSVQQRSQPAASCRSPEQVCA